MVESPIPETWIRRNVGYKVPSTTLFFLHCTHCVSTVAFANASQHVGCALACRVRKTHFCVLHCTVPLMQLPGCIDGFPCNSACVSSVNRPQRKCSCTLRSQTSLVRSHSCSSVTPRIPVSRSSLQRRLCPCAMLGIGACLRAFRIYSTGFSPRNPPSGGGSCQTSSLNKTFRPPSERCMPCFFL